MSQSKLVLLLSVFLSTLFLACSEPSMQEDARKAAELSRLSNVSAMENNLSAAAELYTECQEIMDKYRRNGQFDEFYELYTSFLQESAVLEDERRESLSSDTEQNLTPIN